MQNKDVTKIAKALNEPKRLEILDLINGKEMCANHILKSFEITQPTLSHHLKILTECKLVKVRKDGKLTYYSINQETFTEYINTIKKYEKK